MNTTETQTPDEPSPDYWRDLAVERLGALPGLRPGVGATACEKRLWGHLVTLQAAAYRVLSDVDDDGVAEAHDMAVLGLREAVAVSVAPKAPPGSRVVRVAGGPGRRITTT